MVCNHQELNDEDWNRTVLHPHIIKRLRSGICWECMLAWQTSCGAYYHATGEQRVVNVELRLDLIMDYRLLVV